ncbi:MAG: LamG domain-containing protein [Lentisphaeria bacterium]|nr:LamG domain-containing protein [Lentisphaeria bacterium]
MRKNIFLLAVLGLFTAVSAVETAYYSFNETALANGTAAKGKIVRGSDVTDETMLTQGIDGKAILIGNSSNKTDKQTIEFIPATPISGKEGAVSFWVRNNDWKPADSKNFHHFFSAFSARERLIVYKYIEHSNLIFFLGNLNDAQKNKSVQGSIKDWQIGSWHNVCVSWNAEKMALYLDGKLLAESPRKDNSSDFTKFQLGEYWAGNPGSTSIDELRIFNNFLSLEDVQAEYSKYSAK